MSLLHLIYDREQVIEFHKILPSIEEEDLYYCVSLLARNKYLKPGETSLNGINRDDSSLEKRFIDEDNPYDYLRELQNFEVEEGGYVNFRSKEVIPKHCMALYAYTNPRSFKKANLDFLRDTTDKALQGHSYEGRKLHKKLLSYLVKSKAGTRMMALDVDYKDGALESWVSLFGEYFNVFNVVETRGGYHILFDPGTAQDIDWHKEISEAANVACRAQGSSTAVELKSDAMTPIPGTYQGGFQVKLLGTRELDNYKS